jgi:thiol-disulfide isomerase/thioredoxin
MPNVPDRRRLLGVLGIGLAAAASGALLSWRLGREPYEVAVLREAWVTDLAGKRRNLLQWQGQILVVNFWATWCEPCREEIPAFMQVRHKLLRSGVEFVGIAIDQAAKVALFARTVQIDYPLLLAGSDGLDLMRKLGNPSGGLPFTVVLDRKGTIAFRNLGALAGSKIEAQLLRMVYS